MVNYSQRQLDLAFGALAHPIRRGILARLSTGEATVAELAKPYKVSAPAISKHLRILERAKLLSWRKHGREHHRRSPSNAVQSDHQPDHAAPDIFERRSLHHAGSPRQQDHTSVQSGPTLAHR